MNNPLILAGDTGGTKTRLAQYSFRSDHSLHQERFEEFESSKFPSLEAIVTSFNSNNPEPFEAACFGVPGPVDQGRALTTNLPWTVEASALSAALKGSQVLLVNDLVATAAAVPHLSDSGRETLYEGSGCEPLDLAAVVAPGTGLGQAYLKGGAKQYQVFASEGGHVDFSPSTPQQVELYEYLRSKFDRVSLERILCGPGLKNIFDFLIEVSGSSLDPKLSAEFETKKAAAVISEYAIKHHDPICQQALEIFCDILGMHCGNVALTYICGAGLFLGGGIPPKILPFLKNSQFVEHYLAKGRLRHLVEKISVHVIRDDHAALLGAAGLAAQLV